MLLKKDLIYLIFFTILFILYFHLRSKNSNNKVEKFTNNHSHKLDMTEIQNLINEKYKVDIEAIRNLSELATKLQKDGLVVPGDLHVRGHTNIDGNFNINGDFNYLPKGTIVAYNGKTAPSGWALCNGEKGTPDLTKRFIIGASSLETDSKFTLGEKNGSNKIAQKQIPNYKLHSLNEKVFDGEHTHNMPFKYKYSYSTASGDNGSEPLYTDDRSAAFGPIAAHTQSGNTGTYNNLMNSMKGNSTHTHNSGGSGEDYWQPYYALSYIMKL